MLIAQIWIKHHSKIFVYLCWFNWFIIKENNWVQGHSFLPTKYNFFSLLACLLGYGLKFIFHLEAQLPIFSKSSLRSLAQVLISLTTENRKNVESIHWVSLTAHTFLNVSDYSSRSRRKNMPSVTKVSILERVSDITRISCTLSNELLGDFCIDPSI